MEPTRSTSVFNHMPDAVSPSRRSRLTSLMLVIIFAAVILFGAAVWLTVS